MTEQSYSLPDENVPPPPEPPSRTPDVTRVFWQGKFWPAFWTIAGIFSVVLNGIVVKANMIVATTHNVPTMEKAIQQAASEIFK